VLPWLSGDDLMLAMDADSQLNDGWIATAADALMSDQSVGACCGVFVGEPGGGFIGQVQRSEYRRR
jgi:poly-beta-1,6-N-acetyl-D-glucosamine synthase